MVNILSITLSFYEEPAQRDVCPVTYFLALAILDGAVDESDILSNKPVTLGKKSDIIRMNDGFTDVPILRAIENQSRILQDRILKYSSLNHFLSQLGKRAGYEDNLTSYCFRRGASNKFNGK